jgi:hypothetical protein
MAVPIVARGGFIVDNGTELPLDPFARVRVSQPNTMYQLMSNTFLGTVNTKQVHQVSEFVSAAGGTSVVSESDGTVVMSVTAADALVVRQSRQYIPYQPGKGRLVFMSGMLTTSTGGGVSGATSRLGIFDDHNPTEARIGAGHFFELSGTTLSVVERSMGEDVSGNVVETRIPRSSWNGDRLDGSGPSKFTIDLSRMQLFWMDMEWLGVGFVRFGVVHEGKLVICHTIYHTNALTGTYTRTPKLPVRFEISSSGAFAGEASMKMACATVISEGGYVPRGIPMDLPQDVAITLGTNNVTPVLALSLRPESYAVRATLIPRSVSVACIDNQPVWYQVLLAFSQPTSPLITWTNVNTSLSLARYSATPGILPTTNIYSFAGGVTVARDQTKFEFTPEQGLDGIPFLSGSYSGVPDILYVAVKRLKSTATTVHVTVTWDELQV